MKCLLLIIGLALAIPSAVRAQWQRLPDPPGALALTFAESPDGTVYSGTINGVWVSIDHMASWQPVGLQGAAIWAVGIAPDSTGDILFATDQRVLYRSNDSGKTWKTIDTAFDGGMLNYNNALITWNFDDTANFISMTTNAGLQWRVVADAPPNAGSFSLAVSHGILFATSSNSGLWSIPIAGGNWSSIPYPGSGPECIQVFDSTIVVADKKAYLSPDLGQTWIAPANKGLDTLNQGFGSVAMLGNVIVANWSNGIVRSTDSARTWTYFGGTGGFPNTTSPYPGGGDGAEVSYTDGTIVVSGPMGIYRSSDGYTWTFASQGMTCPHVGDIISFHDTLFASVNGAVYHSANQGETWDDQGDMQSVYHFVATQGMLFALSDNGLVWRWRNGKWESSEAPVELTLAMVDSTLFGCRWNELLISKDTGARWKQAGSPEWLQYIYSFGDTLFALPNVGAAGWPLSFSTDHGENWTYASTFPTQGGYFYMLGAQDSDDLLIYNYGMMNLSTDHGFHWQTIDHHFATNEKSWNNQIFVMLSDTEPSWSGLFKLSGTNLVQLLPDAGTGTIESFAADDNYAYISTSSKGIWRTPASNPQLAVSSTLVSYSQVLQVYPNPSATQSTISFFLPAREYISLKLYDECGTFRRAILGGEHDAGSVSIPFSGPSLPNGIYEVVLSTPASHSEGRLVISR